jgi:hypothetical protein
LQLDLIFFNAGHEPVNHLDAFLGQMAQRDGERFRRDLAAKACSVLAILARDGGSSHDVDWKYGAGEACLLGCLADGGIIDGLSKVLTALGENPSVL